MKMNKKGFTLIELLAVIVVLAIIALIATPIVMDTIKKSQEGADARSVEAYGKAIESSYYQGALENNGTYPSGAFTNLDLSGNGSKVVCDQTTYESAINTTTAKVTLTGCKVDGRGTYNYTSADGAKVSGTK